MKRCEHCGESLSEGAAFCPACGRAVLQLPGEGTPASPPGPERELTKTQVGMPIPQVFTPPASPESEKVGQAQNEQPVEAAQAPIEHPVEAADSAKATLIQAPGIAELLNAELGAPSSAVQTASSQSPERPGPAELSTPKPGTPNSQASASESPEKTARVAGSWSDAGASSDSLSDEAWTVDSGSASSPLGSEANATLNAGTTPEAPEVGARAESHVPVLLTILGVLLILGGVAGASLLITPSEKALVIEDARASHRDGLLQVQLGLTALRPVQFAYPGRRQRLEGQHKIRFSLPADPLKFEAHPLRISAREGDVDLPLKVVVEPVYRLRTISASTKQLELQLSHRFGWKASVKPGRLHRIDSTTFRWVVDLTNEAHRGQSTLQASLSLVDLKGEVRSFKEAITVPSVVTPLQLLEPTTDQGVRGAVRVRGLSLPGALIEVGARRVRADERGHFELKVPLEKPGKRTLYISATYEGRETTTREVAVVRRTRAALRREVTRLRKKLKDERKSLPKATYETLRNAEPEMRVYLEGALASLERGELGASIAVISLCETGQRCPVLVQVTGVTLAHPGETVKAVGRVLGLRRYQSQDNHTREVPRVEVEYIVK